MATNKNEVPPFEIVADCLKRSCDFLAARIEPCSDWPRMLILANQAGCTVEPLDDYLTGDSERDQDLLRNGLLPQLARRVNARIAGLLLPAWFIDPADDPDHLHHGGSVIQHPLRRECINLLLVEANRAEAWMAEVERHPRQSPTLGAWIGPCETGGAMVDALQRGVRAKEA
jgi:hypothetical protein